MISGIKKLLMNISSAKEQPIRHESDNGLHIEYRLPSNNNLHNENGPAYISYYDNGKKQYEGYWINGNCHNENGPAYISYYSNGNIESQSYYINNNLHNENGLAIIRYYPNGNIHYQVYLINGRFHNKNGPAFIDYYPNGKIEHQSYYINDRLYTLQEFVYYLLTNEIKFKSSEQIANFIETEGINKYNYYAIADYLEENGYPIIAGSVRKEFI